MPRWFTFSQYNTNAQCRPKPGLSEDPDHAALSDSTLPGLQKGPASSTTARLLLLVTTLSLVTVAGCDLLMDDWERRDVEAQYDGLANQRVAVLVSADREALAHHPDAPARVGQAVGARLATIIPGIKLTDPKQVALYQKNNPYWSLKPFAELTKALDVDRIVHVELSNYRTKDRGNAHVWRGVVSGSVGVAEADSAEPSNLAFLTTIESRFPADAPIGVLDADDETIELGMLDAFSRDVARLFHDHEVYAR